MLSTRAHSFGQQSKLAVSLSWIGGYTNVVTLLATGWVCSHMTGTTTAFGKSLAEAIITGKTANTTAASEVVASSSFTASVSFFGFVLFCFWLGAFSSGLFTEWGHRTRRRSKYILPISIEAWLLAVFSVGMEYFSHGNAGGQWTLFIMVGIAALAMGLQNATITHISGAVVRTTHVTGVVTDLGLETAQYMVWFRDRLRPQRVSPFRRVMRLLSISRRRPDALRLLLLGGLFGSFLLGVVIGGLSFHYCFGLCLWPPVAFLVFIVFMDRRTPIAEIHQMDPAADAEFKLLELAHAMLPTKLGIYRLIPQHDDEVHRPPHFEAWAQHLPRDWRVVILALSSAVELTVNTMADLELANQTLTDENVQLILCGITGAQYRLLRQCGLLARLGRANVLPDLEFAIARGMDLIAQFDPSLATSVR